MTASSAKFKYDCLCGITLMFRILLPVNSYLPPICLSLIKFRTYDSQKNLPIVSLEPNRYHNGVYWGQKNRYQISILWNVLMFGLSKCV